MKEILKRLMRPVVIGGIVSIFGIIVAVAQINIQEVITWAILWKNVVAIVSNPFILLTIAYQIFAFLNNPANKKGF